MLFYKIKCLFSKKYKFPLNLFIIFEHSLPLIYTSELLTPNHFVCIIPIQQAKAFNLVLKKELFYTYGTLIESSAIDTTKYSNFFQSFLNKFNSNNILLFYSYYFYLLKLRLTTIHPYMLNSKIQMQSLETIFKNASWLERETSEMFSILFTNKYDSRTLLLDYSKKEHPMLKNFQSEGNYELYYDFFDQNLHYTKIRSVEL